MKYSVHTYAQAFVEALEEHADAKKGLAEATLGKNFMALVTKNGDESHLANILDEASRLARGKSGIRQVTIESARELSTSQKAELKHFTKPHDVIEERIDPELIAGIKITVNDEMQFDGSLKKKLNKALGNN
jgi:F0F1-type ATP synthase delta subunit